MGRPPPKVQSIEGIFLRPLKIPFGRLTLHLILSKLQIKSIRNYNLDLNFLTVCGLFLCTKF